MDKTGSSPHGINPFHFGFYGPAVRSNDSISQDVLSISYTEPMILVRIETLMVGIPPSPSVVILRPLEDEAGDDERRVLPIWIGPSEAAAIGVALEGIPHSRPMTHDLLTSAVQALHGDIEAVLINRVEGSTFYASVVLTQGDETIEIDARPSDSIALAVRTQAPLYVDEQVLLEASLPFLPGKNREPLDENDVEAFRSFLDSVSPEDFTSS
ncbi:MAG: bifunctional nuclease family protein [Coriobacteriales bacterium]|nr:bifunctional nuclease family protein [Coriobacteriales bacterium]